MQSGVAQAFSMGGGEVAHVVPVRGERGLFAAHVQDACRSCVCVCRRSVRRETTEEK